MLLFTFYRNIAFITASEHMHPLTELKNYFCLIILMPRESLLLPLPRTSVICLQLLVESCRSLFCDFISLFQIL